MKLPATSTSSPRSARVQRFPSIRLSAPVAWTPAPEPRPDPLLSQVLPVTWQCAETRTPSSVLNAAEQPGTVVGPGHAPGDVAEASRHDAVGAVGRGHARADGACRAGEHDPAPGVAARHDALQLPVLQEGDDPAPAPAAHRAVAEPDVAQ